MGSHKKIKAPSFLIVLRTQSCAGLGLRTQQAHCQAFASACSLAHRLHSLSCISLLEYMATRSCYFFQHLGRAGPNPLSTERGSRSHNGLHPQVQPPRCGFQHTSQDLLRTLSLSHPCPSAFSTPDSALSAQGLELLFYFILPASFPSQFSLPAPSLGEPPLIAEAQRHTNV